MPTRPSAVRRPSPTWWRPHAGSTMPASLTQQPPTSGNAGVALRGLSLGPATNGPTALSVDYYTTRGPSQPAWREGRDKTLTDTHFVWKKNVTHRFLRCLRSVCSLLCASPMLLKVVACVVRVFCVMYVPVGVPPTCFQKLNSLCSAYFACGVSLIIVTNIILVHFQMPLSLSAVRLRKEDCAT